MPDRLTGPIAPDTPNFTWDECRCSHCGGLPENLEAVVNAARMMEKVREILGNQPVRVNSWYRCREHNRAIGGASDSQHLYGRAIDFTVKSLTPRQVQARLRRHLGTVVRGLGAYRGFSHADNRPGEVATWSG